MSDEKLTEHVIVTPNLDQVPGADHVWVKAWHKKIGDPVTRDEPLADLETADVVLELPSPVNGILQTIHADVGTAVRPGANLAVVISVPSAAKTKAARSSHPPREKRRRPASESKDQLTPATATTIADGVVRIIQQKLEAQPEVTGRPAKFLGPSSSTVRFDRCFIVMPYSQTWSKGVERIIVESCRAAGFEVDIAKAMDGRFVAHDIWKGITSCGLIIADLSGANANVAYEVGLADAIGREVVLLSQTNSVPFDFLGHRLILYENSAGGAMDLRDLLTDRLKGFRKQHHDGSKEADRK